MWNVNTDLFERTELTTSSTSYVTTIPALTATHEYRDSINDISSNKTQDVESDILSNFAKINDISSNAVPALTADISGNLAKINDISSIII
jgi:hypothetical protein